MSERTTSPASKQMNAPSEQSSTNINQSALEAMVKTLVLLEWTPCQIAKAVCDFQKVISKL